MNNHSLRNKVIGSDVTFFTYRDNYPVVKGKVIQKHSDGYVIKPFACFSDVVYRSFSEIIS